MDRSRILRGPPAHPSTAPVASSDAVVPSGPRVPPRGPRTVVEAFVRALNAAEPGIDERFLTSDFHATTDAAHAFLRDFSSYDEVIRVRRAADRMLTVRFLDLVELPDGRVFTDFAASETSADGTGIAQRIASLFVVRDGRIARITASENVRHIRRLAGLDG